MTYHMKIGEFHTNNDISIVVAQIFYIILYFSREFVTESTS